MEIPHNTVMLILAELGCRLHTELNKETFNFVNAFFALLKNGEHQKLKRGTQAEMLVSAEELGCIGVLECPIGGSNAAWLILSRNTNIPTK